ncbi:MAG: hypothetical protein A4E37_00462 [Methanoregulaceae archaeon PtaB.Bin056]|jgi:hypothetical protein|nr:MAG: hypothetical protein A4E37_00462 [Methanoregulaceae archaeon PtaB.Bin056]
MTREDQKRDREQAVSPVVGVMLMLVVVIIIAAVVSAFAGGIAGGQKKVPQAAIQAEFSITSGMEIRHAGGDPLPMNDLEVVIWDGPTFGPNVEQSTKQVLDMAIMKDKSGNPIKTSTGAFNRTALISGDTLTISASDCECDVLQPNIAPSDYVSGSSSYAGTETSHWGLCIKNANNIGKEFVVSVGDRNGNLIALTNVKVKG